MRWSVSGRGVRIFQFDRLKLVSKRASGPARSLLKRSPIIERFSFLNRRLAQATSSGAASIPAADFFDIAAAGNDGWNNTGATTLDSAIMACAKPAVSHAEV